MAVDLHFETQSFLSERAIAVIPDLNSKKGEGSEVICKDFYLDLTVICSLELESVLSISNLSHKQNLF